MAEGGCDVAMRIGAALADASVCLGKTNGVAESVDSKFALMSGRAVAAEEEEEEEEEVESPLLSAIGGVEVEG